MQSITLRVLLNVIQVSIFEIRADFSMTKSMIYDQLKFCIEIENEGMVRSVVPLLRYLKIRIYGMRTFILCVRGIVHVHNCPKTDKLLYIYRLMNLFLGCGKSTQIARHSSLATKQNLVSTLSESSGGGNILLAVRSNILLGIPVM